MLPSIGGNSCAINQTQLNYFQHSPVQTQKKDAAHSSANGAAKANATCQQKYS